MYEGEITVSDGSKSNVVKKEEMGILSNDSDLLKIKTAGMARLIVIAGKPLGESIVQYGPFVMNTKEQIIQAVEDFRNGNLA